MAHYAIVVDLDRCIGCHGCEIACKNENEVELGSFWNKVVQVGPFGDYPHLQQYFLPVMCQQCEDAPCTHVCPTGASYRDPDTNVVLVDKEKCIGCKYCMMACPYGVRTYDESKDKGVIEKCTMCAHLIDKGEKPACVRHCPGQARKFGDLDDPESDVSKLRAAKKTYKLKDVGNHPGVDYAMDKCAWKGDE